MARFQVYRKTRAEQIYDSLHAMITSPTAAPGEQLATVRALAAKFNTSTFTVQQAIAQLEENGYVTTRPGAGMFINQHHRPIAMQDMVALCIGGHGEHAWGNLSEILADELLDKGQVPVILERKAGKFDRLLERMSHTGAKFFIVRGRLGFPHEMMYQSPFDKKIIIAVVQWLCPDDRPGLYRVLTDFREGGRLVAEHLAGLGHRKVLIVGQPWETQVLHEPFDWVQTAGKPFTEYFTAMGGRWASITSEFPERAQGLDEAQFMSHFEGDDPPTAVFGLRDVEAWLAQSVLRRRMPELLEKVAIVGYYDTPWGHAAAPPFTTVSLNLPAIAAKVREILDDVQHEREVRSNVYRVAPELIVRDTSISA